MSEASEITPTYSYTRILELAPPKDESGWTELTIDLADGETAVNPASTKHLLWGPAKIHYAIHASGITTTVLK